MFTGITVWGVIQVVGPIAYMVLEYWLGKTDKVKAGSVIEAVLNVAKYFIGKK